MSASIYYPLGMAAMLFFTACGSPSGNGSQHSDSTATGTVTNAAPHQPLVKERYVGMLPCADCPGMRTELLLNHEEGHADGEYILTETYLGRSDTPQVSQGVYTTLRGNEKDPNATLIQLNPGKETFFNYLQLDNETLASCGQTEYPPQPKGTLSFKLNKINKEPQAIEGMFRYNADMAAFKPCGSKEVYPVSGKAMYRYVEQLYLYKRTRPGEAMYLSAEGVMDSIVDNADARRPGLIITSIKTLENKPCPATPGRN